MDWLNLRDVLNAACNITSAAYKGVGEWEGVGKVKGRVGKLTMPVNTANQVMCTVS